MKWKKVSECGLPRTGTVVAVILTTAGGDTYLSKKLDTIINYGIDDKFDDRTFRNNSYGQVYKYAVIDLPEED